ncbi:alpha/beta hydrolase [Streptomyces sp. NBC_01803]|uniref:alpha/beta hydrolase n=1 Tax=Streptomyces sp. NBC_01803 TaxID=2975946 RepID=UPI002DD8556E|nr:alpha/beta hydrolase [Streptomyces sp. NBC_01803]WSA47677.1 alpha/beta hydrolase [Streptomyces sp. NBC_01803]
MNTGGRTRAAALAAALALAAGACSGGGPSDDGPGRSPTPGRTGDIGGADARTGPPELPAEFTDQRPAWETCAAPTPVQGTGPAPGPDWECATLTVPLDYAHPDDGETIGIALIRTRSAPRTNRVGSLVFNFGGPGGSGVATLPRVADRYTRLRDGFDLVSFDPRGVGESEGVVCRTGPELDAAAQEDDGPPAGPAEERELLADSRAYAEDCEERAGRLLPHLTTENTARDLDLLRAGLGDDQLHYFGVSYGTKLGAVYAHHFPQHVGRTVLDAVVDPTRDLVQRALLQTEGFQLALDGYLADCVTEADCPTGPATGDPAHAALTALLDDLRERPLPTATGRDLTQGLAVTALLALLYSEDSWPFLTQGLTQALDDGRGDLLLAAAEQYNGRDDEGRYRNLQAANNAVTCADFASRPTLETVHDNEAAFAAASPVFGPHLVWSLLSCASWPVTGERDRPEVSVDGARVILLLATTGDPATPYAGAGRMREAMGGPGAAALLTYEGEGHGAYSSGDACVTAAVDAHLLSGATPADGTVCT